MSVPTASSHIFDALSNPYRRQLLVAMLESNPQAEVDIDPMNLLAPGESEDITVTKEGLIHVHLPKLADMGFIHWDRKTGKISKGPNWETIAPVLRLIHDHSDELPEDWLIGPVSVDNNV